jgi:hypothetical protein
MGNTVKAEEYRTSEPQDNRYYRTRKGDKFIELYKGIGDSWVKREAEANEVIIIEYFHYWVYSVTIV